MDKTAISLGKKLDVVIELVDAMALTQQDMYNKIEHLEKRIRLVEYVDTCQDREIELLVGNGGMGK
jgi:predicted RecB family endonuclease